MYYEPQTYGKHCPDTSIKQARLNSKFSRRFTDDKVTKEQVQEEMRLTIERCTPCVAGHKRA